ncbi:MAG TPA: hypothetical protein VMM92_05890 [Thermoanaerobaculia bacterium]|nr:hypothetical protein [Thermoanaerobaculia bacterium]
MFVIAPSRTLQAAALALLLSVPTTALAAPGRAPEALREVRPAPAKTAPGVLSQAWHLLQSLFGKAGMLTDPNGSPAAAAPGPTLPGVTQALGDSGMSIDPDGAH